MTTQQTLSLSEQNSMPAVGFGTYLISDEDAKDVVGQALSCGYRHIDTAEGYGNEAGVGRALRQAFEQGLAREDVFVTTKLWPGNPEWGQTPKDTKATIAAFDSSLERLGLDYVDLYLIHAPFAPEDRLAQWTALVELQAQGKVRNIGVSNFTEAHIEALEAAGLPLPAANQIELHPWSQKDELVTFLNKKGIRPIAYSSLIPLSTWRSAEGQESAKTDAMRTEGEQADFPFRLMAAKYGVSEAQILLKWALQKGYAVIPKSIKPERMKQNLDLFSFTLDEEDMGAIAKMNRGGGIAWKHGDPLTFG